MLVSQYLSIRVISSSRESLTIVAKHTSRLAPAGIIIRVRKLAIGSSTAPTVLDRA